MADNTLQFPLRVKLDRNGDEYLVGSIDLPASINLREVSFFVFYPPEGEEKATLMIRPRQEKNPKDKVYIPSMED